MFILIGILHFTHTNKFVQIVPPFIPLPEKMVYISGVFEILGAIGLLTSRYRKFAAYGLVILLIAVLPANIYMAIANVQLGGIFNNQLIQWIRIPFQGVIIWLVLWSSTRGN